MMKHLDLSYLIVPYVMFYLCLCPIALMMSLQFSAIFYVTNISCVIMMAVYEKKQANIWIIFLVSGICTSFFDLLTYPLIALFIPLIICLCLGGDKKICKYIKGCITVLFKLGNWIYRYVVWKMDMWKYIIERKYY